MAGVSALRPLLEIAGVEREGKQFTPQDCSLDGLQDGIHIASAAIKGNYIGPLVAALTFVSLSIFSLLPCYKDGIITAQCPGWVKAVKILCAAASE